MVVENELAQAGHKKGKEDRKIEAAREKVLQQYLGDSAAAPAKQQKFADPAMFFK